MPLEKRFQGRRVKRAKRRDNYVLVKLAALAPGDKPQWVRISLAEYRSGVTVKLTTPTQ